MSASCDTARKSKGLTVIDHQTSRTVAVFYRPFDRPGFDETPPGAAYDIETERASPPDHHVRKASVVVPQHPGVSQPGLARSLAVSLGDRDNSRAKDKLSGKELSGVFLEDMRADPMGPLVMQADGVAKAHSHTSRPRVDHPDRKSEAHRISICSHDRLDVQDAESDGMSCQTGLHLSANDVEKAAGPVR